MHCITQLLKKQLVQVTTIINDEYTATAIGVNYAIVGGGLNVGVSHTMFDYTDATNASATAGQGSNDGSSTLLMMTLTF